MSDINERISKLENVIKDLVNSFKKIEDIKKKEDLYSFSTQQLIKWLKDNEINYNENVKDVIIDIVWKNLNEWEWEYYYEDNEDNEEPEPELGSESSSVSELSESEKSKSFSSENISKKTKKK